MNLKKSTPNNVLLGELGRYPAEIFIRSRMIGFWHRIISGKQDKICSLLYRLLFKLEEHNLLHSKWLFNVEKTLNDCGLSEFWLAQYVPKHVSLSKMVKARLMDQFKQNWYSSIYDMSKTINYRIFKVTHSFENYLTSLPVDLRRALCRFRCMNHRFPIEKGRFWGVDRDDRIFDLCQTRNLGDEFHYLLECDFFKSERKKFLPRHFIVNPNTAKFHDLINCEDNRVLFGLAKFCKILLSLVN